MNEEVIFNQCRALISQAEQSLQKIENHNFQLRQEFERRIADLESKYENLAQQVRARDVV